MRLILIVFGFIFGSLYYLFFKEKSVPRYHKIHGRVFEVHAEPNAQRANAYMAANPGMGLLEELPSGECLMAACENRGVELGEVPFAIRCALEAA